jgi:hypothetical protein
MDDNFSDSNQFNEFPALEAHIEVGVYEFSFGLEPILGFSYVSKTSKGLIAENGLKSEDKFRYRFFTVHAGARYKLFEPNTFFIIPVFDLFLTYRYGFFNKIAAVKEGDDSTGGDLGASIGGGIIFSFMIDKRLLYEMQKDYGVKDFGLLITGHFLPAGLFSHGLGSTSTTGGWDGGIALYMDW